MIAALLVAPGPAPAIAARAAADDLGLGDKTAAEGTRSLLLVLQGVDAAGKDGVIRSVFSGVNPQGVRVTSFRAPTEAERAHVVPTDSNWVKSTAVARLLVDALAEMDPKLPEPGIEGPVVE